MSNEHPAFSVKPDENANNAPIEIKQKSAESEEMIVENPVSADMEKKNKEQEHIEAV